MSTSSRLTKVFGEAVSRELPFDDTSKIVLFSDCHRGDNSWADDFARNQLLVFHALKWYLAEGYTYIELGDGDELYENRRFSDIRKAHDHIFWLLSEFHRTGRLHLIHGNHDMLHGNPAVAKIDLYSYFDDRQGKTLPLFDGIEVFEGMVLRHEPTGGRLFLVHGHQGDVLNDSLWRIGRFFVRHVWRHVQLLGIKDPTSPAQNFRKRGKVERTLMEWVEKARQPMVCGHTHRPWFSGEGDCPYFNTGSCVHPRCVTGIEIANGELELIKWWLEPGAAGTIAVSRRSIAGPRSLKSLFGTATPRV